MKNRKHFYHKPLHWPHTSQSRLLVTLYLLNCVIGWNKFTLQAQSQPAVPFHEPYNVMEYGAIGDGQVNAAAEIQKAIVHLNECPDNVEFG